MDYESPFLVLRPVKTNKCNVLPGFSEAAESKARRYCIGIWTLILASVSTHRHSRLPRKARLNERRHGVSFEEAATAFLDPLSLTIRDLLHVVGEERFVLIGQSDRGKLVVVVHAEHGNEIRPISARRAMPHERRAYEEEEIY